MGRKLKGVGFTPYEQPQPKSSITSQPPVWLDGQDLMQRLHISARTLQHWRSKHIIPYQKVGRKIFYNEAEVNSMIAKNRVNPSTKD